MQRSWFQPHFKSDHKENRMRYCNQCGGQVRDDAAFCNSCGAKLNFGGSPKAAPSGKPKPQAWPQDNNAGNQAFPHNNGPVNRAFPQDNYHNDQAFSQGSFQNNQPDPNSYYPRAITPIGNPKKNPNSKLIYIVVSLVFINLILLGVLLFFILGKPSDNDTKLTSKGSDSVTEDSNGKDSASEKDKDNDNDGFFNKPSESVGETDNEDNYNADTKDDFRADMEDNKEKPAADIDYDLSEDTPVSADNEVPSGTIYVYSFTDEVPTMIDVFLETHPNFGYSVESTIVSTADGAYQQALDKALASGGSDAPDLFCVEEAFVLKYTQGDMSSYACPYSNLGIDVEAELAKAQIAPYTVDIGTNRDGQLVGLGYQSTGGCFIYRRSIARNVFGTDDPASISEIIGGGSGNLDKFFNAAQTLRGRGVSILSGTGDLWTVCRHNADKGWIVNGKLHIDPKIEKFMDYAKILVENGYTNDTTQWSDAWFNDMADKGTRPVFGYFGPAWLINYTIAPNCGGEKIGEGTYGDWAVCDPPIGFYWGGTWLIANNNSDKKKAVGEIIDWITLNCTEDGLQYKWANGTVYYDGGIPDTVASDTVLNIAYNGSTDFLGGQNMFDYFIPANRYASGKSMTQYDDSLNYEWQEQAYSYAHGQKDKNTAIADFKHFVKDQFGIEPE